MRRADRPGLPTVPVRLPVVVLTAAVVAGAVVLAAPQVIMMGRHDVVTAIVFALAVSVGELFVVTLFERHRTAPLSTASALALCLLPGVLASGPPARSAAVVLTVIAVAMGGGAMARCLMREPVDLSALCVRFLGLAVVAGLYRGSAWFDGRSPIQLAEQMEGDLRWGIALWMLAVAVLGIMVVQLGLEGALRSERDQSPLFGTVGAEIMSGAGPTSALVVTGALIALGDAALGIAALPLFLFPLLFTQFAVIRYGAVRRTYTETIRALSRLTDVAGYTSPGHAGRVESLSVAMARVLGMSPREITQVEYAALLHDLGQVALREPIPGGATMLAAPADQRRIAQDGADIVRQTGVLDQVAVILEAQTTPYRQVREFGEPLPQASRIIKVANAFDDLAGPLPDQGAVRRALERINLGLGYEYDPQVVDAITRVLQRRGRQVS